MSRIPRWVWYFILLLVLTAVAIVAPYLYNLSQQLKPEQVREAVERWARNGPADYDLIQKEKVDRKGEESTLSNYEVKVRKGELVELRLNGKEILLDRLSAERRELFTVPGLLK